MAGVARGCGSVFSTLPEGVNGRGSLSNAGDGGATSNHQRNNVIKRPSSCFCQRAIIIPQEPTVGEGHCDKHSLLVHFNVCQAASRWPQHPFQ
ncbi:unnamed protein product, partial [Rangifer tarandus platyrhynchus]